MHCRRHDIGFSNSGIDKMHFAFICHVLFMGQSSLEAKLHPAVGEELVSRMPLRSELVTFKVTVDVLNRCTVLDFSRPLLVTHDSYR
jgi:hypothetical protein